MQEDHLENDEGNGELSSSTYVVLCLLGTFFAIALSLACYRILSSIFRRDVSDDDQPAQIRPKPAKKSVPVKDATVAVKLPAQTQPQKPGVSLKTLMKHSQQAQSKQVAADKPVDHPLYVNAIRACQDRITGISFSSDGRELAVACEDRVLRVFRVEDVGTKHFNFKRRELVRDLVDVAFGAGGDLFVLSKGGIDSAVLELYKYEADTSRGDAFPLAWEKKGVHGREAGKGLQAGVNSRGQSLAVSYSAQTDLQLFSHSGVELASINSSGLQNHEVGFSRQGRFFGAATFTSDVRLYEVQYTREGDLKKVPKVMDLKKAHNGQVLSVAFSPEGNKAVTASKDRTWAVWNLDVRYVQDEDPKILLKAAQETDGTERYHKLAFGPGNIIAAAFGTTIHFLDARHGTLLESIEDAHDAPITAIEWSPTLHKLGSTRKAILASSSYDKRVRLWRAPLVSQ